jgi:ElaB/YqjD/DUF883 family membrane-anchored ribosome-binding protein
MAKGNYLNATSAEMAPDRTEALDNDRSAEEIRQDIAARRESITETVDRLSDRFQETFDWRTYVTRHPLAAIGVAAGLGVLVSGIFKPRPTPMERIQEALADGFEDFSGQVRSQLSGLSGIVPRPGVSQTVKAAATGYLVKAASEYLRNRYMSAPEKDPGELDRRADYSIPQTAPLD